MVNEWADPYYYRPPVEKPLRAPRPGIARGDESVALVVWAPAPALLASPPALPWMDAPAPTAQAAGR